MASPSSIQRRKLLSFACLLGAGYAAASVVQLAWIAADRGFPEDLVYPPVLRLPTLLFISGLLLLLASLLVLIAWRSMRSSSPDGSVAEDWHPASILLWSLGAAWWLLVNHPTPPLAHHFDKYVIGLVLLTLWSATYLTTPRALNAWCRSRLFALITMISVNLLIFLFIGELACRIADPFLTQIGPFGKTKTPSYLVPHAEVEGSIGRSNALGFRDREWSQEKQASAPRIIALGDSFTYGAGVSYDETFVTLLSAILARHRPGAEILNMGVPGWGPEEELALLKSTVLDYHPNLVILNIYAGNDIVEGSRPVSALLIGGHRIRVHTTGNWFHDNLGFQQWFLNHQLTLLASAAPQLNLTAAVSSLQPPGRQSPRPRWRRSAQWFCSLYGKRPSPYFEFHWDRARRAYEQMLTILRSHGTAFLVVLHPDPEQLFEWTARHNCSRGANHEEYDFERPQRYLLEWASAHLVPIVNLLPSFRTLPNPEAYFLGRIDDNHYSQEGHRLAAEQIFPALIEQLDHLP